MRVRFAPSPTGSLHVGGARAALFNWLMVRQSGGEFLLRIEDTDRGRSRPEHVDAILEGLSWLGMDWDWEPRFQADGTERHRADALALLDLGAAYRDFTPQSDFARARDAAVEVGSGAVTRLARELAAEVGEAEGRARAAQGEPFAVRFQVPEGETAWDDLVHDELRFANAEIDDFVILRSDGTPTYNLAVASDDAEMGITHVLRGDDHISNTPKQILIYEALGRERPAFGHLPMILGPDGRRLSKRHGARSVRDYRSDGILPEAMVNFLALLGWSPGDDEELLSREELIRRFSLGRVLRKGAVFDPAKLEWMNGRYIAAMRPDELDSALRDALRRDGVSGDGIRLSDEAFLRLAGALAPRSRTLAQMARLARPYVGSIDAYDSKAARKLWLRDREGAVALLEAVAERLTAAEWTAEALEASLRSLAAAMSVGAGKVFQPLRLALTGQSASPGIFDVLLVLGRGRSLARIRRGIEWIAAERVDSVP
ncbi:MAG: glutamate--tRNA ligase [Gemmatimonadetes bacterium]|nr:glutamate--tRNA ligase [Gemmatimonadota bacterium]MCY3942276.1 glutamate--tRNA ligase [Gemmatimonadota bacterium]